MPSFVRSLAFGLTLVVSATAVAQQNRFDQRNIDLWLGTQNNEDVRLRSERADLAPLDTMFDWQWGGWLEYYVFTFQDGEQNQRLLQRPAMALWTRLRADDGAHEIFARMRLTYERFGIGDEFVRRTDWIGPNLDRGWYRIDIGRAFRLNQPSDPLQLAVKVGRQNMQFGTGYVLDLPMDAVVIESQIHDFEISGLIGKTIASFPNIDRSEPVDGHSNRHFFGVQVEYEGFDHHEPFGYVIWNNDRTDERPKDPFQDYAYDSRYFGIGSRGDLKHNLNYWFEVTYENGKSFGDGNFIRQDDISAWGLDVGIEKVYDHPMRPRVMFEYMFASGDGDRRLSPTNAAGGNRGDREDTSFNAFGFRDTGIASNLVNSNLHVWKLGSSFTPFPDERRLRDLELGTNWFLYHKHQSSGALSDPTADMYSGYAGWEMDYYVNWRLSSDLSWTARWGAFFPGDAYSDRGTRHFLFTGLTWSF